VGDLEVLDNTTSSSYTFQLEHSLVDIVDFVTYTSRTDVT